jgi:hypothetical protein
MPSKIKNPERAKRRKEYPKSGAKAAWDRYFATTESMSEKIARLRAVRLAPEAAGH